MEQDIGLIGFGEAGSTFALAGGWTSQAHVHDLKTDIPDQRAAMLDAYAQAGVRGCATLAEAIAGADIILSLVTADQALAAARAAALAAPGKLYCDMNSVAPQTKRAAAEAIEGAGGHYVDVAVMAPVHPLRLGVPLLISGGRAREAAERLTSLGFGDVRIVGDVVGRASAIKMIRSVIVKGLEALTAECVLAAEAAGVRDEVLASLDASDKPKPWSERADYNLDRMMAHGLRRAAEMEEVVMTLDSLGIDPAMSSATVARQRAIGRLGLAPPATLKAKLACINGKKAQAA